MIQYEMINGQLCRMVEPEPLTPEAIFPCVVRLIQDDTLLGKANKRVCPQETLANKRICNELTDDGLFMDGNYTYRYEIIGYPVVEGSAEWALHQMMQGANVIHRSSAKNEFVRLHGNLIFSDYLGSAFCKADDFLKTACADGWQIHEPEPEFKVGDWVEVNCYNNHHGEIEAIFDKDYEIDGINLYDYPTFTITGLSGHFSFNSIIRKLDPSEVKVKITLEGTVSQDKILDGASCFTLKTGRSEYIISLHEIEEDELVESLLKAQEER